MTKAFLHSRHTEMEIREGSAITGLMNKIRILVFGILTVVSLLMLVSQAHALLAWKGNFGVGGCPQYVAIGDFNEDGKQDLVTANVCVGTVSVLFGDGTGSFGSRSDFSAGTTPRSLA